jgi:hypothetical protein
MEMTPYTFHHFSKQDKEILGEFTNEYVHYFSYRIWGGRRMWWFVDSIYVGRWKNPNGNPSDFIRTRHGTMKRYHTSIEAILDDCMKAGRWHI